MLFDHGSCDYYWDIYYHCYLFWPTHIGFPYVFTFILMSHNMKIPYFYLPHFLVSNGALYFVKFSGTFLSFYIDVVLMLSIGYIGSSDGTKPLHKQCWLKLCIQLTVVSQEMLMNLICKMCLESNILDINMWEQNYSGSTSAISWLLMPWLLALPGFSTHDIDYIEYVSWHP